MFKILLYVGGFCQNLALLHLVSSSECRGVSFSCFLQNPEAFRNIHFLLASLNSSLLGFVLIGTCELRLMYGAIQSDSLQPQKWIPASLRVQGLTLDSEGYRQKLSFLSYLPVLSLSVFIQISDQANCACRNLHLYKPCIFFVTFQD